MAIVHIDRLFGSNMLCFCFFLFLCRCCWFDFSLLYSEWENVDAGLLLIILWQKFARLKSFMKTKRKKNRNSLREKNWLYLHLLFVPPFNVTFFFFLFSFCSKEFQTSFSHSSNRLCHKPIIYSFLVWPLLQKYFRCFSFSIFFFCSVHK